MIRKMLLTAVLLMNFMSTCTKHTKSDALKTSNQLLVVYTKDWETIQGQLQRFAKNAAGGWEPVGDVINVCVGKNGLGWGLGLHPSVTKQPQKREGDLKAPAGIFAVSTLFSKSDEAKDTYKKMPVHIIRPSTEAIDDPKSRYYNRIVETNTVEEQSRDWKSSEKMNKVDLYDLGAVVDHNFPVQDRKAGSCIFIHRWRSPGSPTAGCTGMDAADLAIVCSWLDSSQNPLLVQMPLSAYKAFKKEWQLADILTDNGS